MLVATGGSIAVWSTEQDTRTVLAAARELPAGATLSAGDLAIAHARLDDTIYAAALPASDLSRVVGRQLAEPAHANQVLAAAQLSSHPALAPGQLVLAIPIHAESAAGGRLRPGDQVQVLGTDTKHDGSTHVVLARAVVYDTARDQASTGASGAGGTGGTVEVGTSGVGSATSWISVVVSQDQAVQLAQARWAGELDIALLPPGTGSQ